VLETPDEKIRAREWFDASLACVIAALLFSNAAAAESRPEIKVTLLGIGSPIPDPQRNGPATLVQAGGQNLLFDAGREVTTRLYQLKLPMRDVNSVFITHYHSDHVNGLPDLWLTGWLGAPWAKRTSPTRIIGPTGLKELTDNLTKAYAADIRIRMADEDYPAAGVGVCEWIYRNVNCIGSAKNIVPPSQECRTHRRRRSP
jgi:ribonuclease Z